MTGTSAALMLLMLTGSATAEVLRLCMCRGGWAKRARQHRMQHVASAFLDGLTLITRPW